MDKRLLFSAILAASIAAQDAHAVELSAPVLKNPLTLNPAEMTGTDTVYIYNVKAGKWLNKGNAYGTQTSLAETGMKVALIPNKTGGKFNGTFSLYNNSNNPAAGADWTRRMFFKNHDENGGQSYVDYNNQGAWKCNWVIYPKGNSFELQADTISANQASWDTYADIVNNSRAGWNPSADETDGKGEPATSSIFRPALNMNAEGASEFGVEWQAYNETEYLLYSTRVALKKAIEEAEGVDLTDAINVYNNQNATAEELVATLQLVKDLIRNASMEGADIDNPVDLTEYLANANCDNLNGWDHECEYDKDGNVGSGGHGTNWQNQTHGYTSEDGEFTTNKFIERWVNSASNPDTNNEAGTGHLSDGHVSQKLTNLPKGAYRLSCYAMATQQGRGDDYEVEGVSLFAQPGKGEGSAKTVATKNEKPQKFEFLLYLEEMDDLTIGFKLENTTANWVFVDEFKLEYCGTEKAPMFLQQMNNIKDKLIDAASQYAYEGYLEEANATTEEAGNKTTATPTEEIQALTAKMQELIQKINESVEKYQTLIALYEEIQKFEGEGGTANDDLNALMEDCGNGTSLEDLAYTNATLNNEALDEYMDKLKKALEESRKNSIKPGSDVTYKIVNPSFTNGSNGWTNPKTVDGKFQNCEAYQATFDMYQDIADLPDGVYELTAQAMHRIANNDVASGDGDSQERITAVLYANDINSKFASPYSYGMAAPSGGSPADWAYTKDGEEVYIPNSMQGFMTACNESEDAYKTTVFVLVTDGNLRIGVRETARPDAGGGDWAIWDNFKLTFVGNDNDAISKVSGPVIAQAEALYDKPMAATELSALKAAVAELTTNGSSETIKAATEAIKAAAASAEAYVSLNSAIENAQNRYELNEMTNTTSDDAKAVYNEAYNTAKNGYENGTIETVDVPEAIRTLNIGVTKYVVNDAVKTATAEAPANVTNAIVNSDFATMDATGWTYEGGAPGFQAGNRVEAGEFYNRTYNMKQEIVGLPKGVYYLKSRSFYREGNNPTATLEDGTTKLYEQNEKAFVYFANNAEISETATENKATLIKKATLQPIAALQIANKELNEVAALGSTDGLALYVDNADDNEDIYIPNDMIRAQAFFNSTKGNKYDSEAVRIDYDGESKFFIGIYKNESVGNDWTIFKNFTLQYAGTEGYSGIENIAGETTAETVSTKIYNAAGVQSGKLQKGINIVVSTLSDGSKKVSKVIVK